MKKILFFCVSIILSLSCYSQNGDTVKLNNPVSEAAYYINHAGVVAGIGGAFVAGGVICASVGIVSYSSSFVSKAPLFISAGCFIGFAVCVFITADCLKKAGLKLNRVNIKNNGITIDLD